MATRTGYKITVYLDDNPLSPTYMETYEEKTLDEETCPIPTDDLVLVSNECEITLSGYSGYRIATYYNTTTGEYTTEKVEDPDCTASSTDEQWVNSGSPYCEVSDKGVNTGYMLQPQVQSNINLENYGETRVSKYKSPDCGSNGCAIWDDIQKQCHMLVTDCNIRFDGTTDVSQIDINPLSSTYNQTRTINRQDEECVNCTNTVFSWVDLGTMCGDNEVLCNNGIQEVSINSYTVLQKYKTIGSGNPIPMDEYQVTLNLENDEDCGYIPPQYRWDVVQGQYTCDEETYTKYQTLVNMVSYDGGVTWGTKQPIETKRGDVLAYDSYDCGKPMERWVDTGERVCEDNGDDGKFVYWNEESVMTESYPCNESSVLTYAEYQAMTTISSGITSKDRYKSTYQVGNCVSEIADGGLKWLDNKKKIWLGNYTEKLGYECMCGYDRLTLEIPSRVNDMSHKTFGTSVWNGAAGCWDIVCDTYNLRVMVMHPTTPPLLEHDDDLPGLFVLAPDDATSAGKANAYNGSAIFVPNESYDLYCTANVWSRHANSIKGRILPMNNDSVSYKAIIDYESDFTSWRYFVPDGVNANTIGAEEKVYGRVIITAITITNKVTRIASGAFYDSDDYDSMYHIKSIDLGETVEYIGSNAFLDGNSSDVHGDVSSLIIPRSVRYIGDSAFNGYPLTSLTIHNGVETIGNNVFRGNLITTLTIPDSVKTIGEYAFAPDDNNAQLTEITIGSGVKEIGQGAFYRSVTNQGQVLQRVYVRALVPPTIPDTKAIHIFGDTFSKVSPEQSIYAPYGNFTVYVPYESYQDYMSSSWQFFDLGSCSVVPYNIDGVKIATLYLDDGTTVEVDVLEREILSDYANVTTAITVNSNCKTIIDNAFVDFAKLDRITMESSVPVPIGNLQTKYFDVPKIYVPSNAYETYLSEWSEYEGHIIPIGAQESYVKKYTFLDLYDGNKKDKYKLTIKYNGQSIEKDLYRIDVVENDCCSVSYNTDGVIGGLGSELNTYKHVWNQIKNSSVVKKMVYISNLELYSLGDLTVRMTFSNIPSSTLTLPFHIDIYNHNDNSKNPNGTISFYSGNTEVTELRKSQAYNDPEYGDGWHVSYNVDIPTSDGVCGVYFNFKINDVRSYDDEFYNHHTRFVKLSLDREIILESYN